MEHNNLTIVAIYGHNDGASAIPALAHSMSQLPGSKGLLLSILMPISLPPNIEWRKIHPLSYQQYSVFVMHSLYAFIETDYCLVVQDDGWVLDGKNFLPSYYDYDYIGCMTHAALVGNHLKLKGTWVDEYPRTIVQNGGFSLRSKRYLEAPNKLGITHTNTDNIFTWNEDVQLTAMKKRLFQQEGIKYAPDEVAMNFGIEYAVPTLYDGFDYTKLLGHHGQTRRLVGTNHVVVTVPRSEVDTFVGEVDFLAHLESLGYIVEYAATHHPEA